MKDQFIYIALGLLVIFILWRWVEDYLFAKAARTSSLTPAEDIINKIDPIFPGDYYDDFPYDFPAPVDEAVLPVIEEEPRYPVRRPGAEDALLPRRVEEKTLTNIPVPKEGLRERLSVRLEDQPIYDYVGPRVREEIPRKEVFAT